MSDNHQQDSGTSEEEIIYIEDYEEFTPVQMMKIIIIIYLRSAYMDIDNTCRNLIS